MALRIKTNVSSQISQRYLGTSTQNKQSSMEKLSSGFRINKAADDAAGLAVSENMRSRSRSLSQAKRNANDGISVVQVAEGSMNEISNILIRLKELAIQSGTDTLNNDQRSFMNKEYTELVSEIERISKVTQFNGIELLGGSEAEANSMIGDGVLSIHVGAGSGFSENVDSIGIKLDDIAIDAFDGLKLGVESEVGPDELGESFTSTDAREKIDVIEQALVSVNEKRSELGANQNRLSSAINNLGVEVENINSSMSRIRDVDFAAETAKFTQAKIMSQSGVSMLSQANSDPELALSLLR